MAEGWERQVGDLYRLDPDDFVPARNELAKQVRNEDRRAATAIRNLSKPTLAAWALNQVAHTSPELVAAVLASTDELSSAQQRALAGDRGPLKAAAETRRKAIASATDAAVAALEGAGRAGEAHREALRNTLEAASLDTVARGLLEGGRLEHEMDPPAIFAGFPPEPDPTVPGDRDLTDLADPAELEREARRARAEAEDLAELAATARERAHEAAQALREARDAVQAAERRLSEAQRELQRAVDGAKTASLRAAEVERRAEDAERRAADLESRL